MIAIQLHRFLLAGCVLAHLPAQQHVAGPHLSPMAGRWFPAEAGALRQIVDRSWTTAEKRTANAPRRAKLLGLVVPHAGLEYSGAVAAAAYRQIGSPRNIVLLGFSHRVALEGVTAPRVTSYATAAGAVTVNTAAVAALGVPLIDEARLCDHSLENQLPFLHRAAPRAQLIPLYVGSLTPARIAPLAKKLAAHVAQGDIVIASSDFTHYGEAYRHTPFPNDRQLPERLRERANEAFEEISSLDVSAFDRYLEHTGDTICGRDPIRLLMATMAAIPGEDVFMTVLDSMASAELTGDYSLSVSYGALGFYPGSSFAVGEQARRSLLSHSRTALEVHLAGGAKRGTQADSPSSPELRQRTGVFVTIRKQGELRGCVGTLAPRLPIPETVADRTIAAASSDPRFRTLSREDGPVTLEVSLLTPLKRLPDWRAFRNGLGAVLMLDERGGLLLPQVAREMGWNARQFLEGLSQKAGLPPQAYRDPKARLYVFRAQVFGEQ